MDNNNKDNNNQLEEFLDFMAANKSHFNSGKAYARFKHRTQEIHHTPRKIFRKWISVAAILIPFLFLSYFTYKYLSLSVEGVTTFSEVIVPNGSKTQLVLEDGTKVWINSGSVIQFNSDFGKKQRIMKLSGEAYLEVAHMDNCPFVVSSGELSVKVLGTRFNVNAYEQSNEIKVALLEGSVEMATLDGEPVILLPKDIALYNVVSKETKVHHNATDNRMHWIDNKLYFHGETFEEIARTLERNYNVKINIHKDSLKDRPFGGDFPNNETIEQIFKIMSSDNKFTYKIKGNTIDVY